MESLRRPDPLKLDGNVAEQWKKFKRQLEIFITAAGLEGKNAKEKAAILLNLIGDEACDVFETLNLNDEHRKDYAHVLDAFEKYCTPRKNVVYERFVFYSRNQKEAEPFQQFYAEIHKLAQNCEFQGGVLNVNELVRDRLVLGTVHPELQEQLIRMSEPSLENVVLKSKLFEKNTEHTKHIQEASQFKAIDAIQSRGGQRATSHQQTTKHTCKYCNFEHSKGRCPAFGKKCNKCGKTNHFASVCRASASAVNEVESRETNDELNEHFFIDSIRVVNNISMDQSLAGKWYEIIVVEGHNIKFKLDTGSDVNILPKRVLDKMNRTHGVMHTSITLEAYGGLRIEILGKITLGCRYGNGTKYFDFLIAENDSTKPILGHKACEDLVLVERKWANGRRSITEGSTTENAVFGITSTVSKNKFVEANKDQFSGIGSLKKAQRLELLPNATPVALPPKRIPSKIVKNVEAKINELIDKGIIVKVTEPSEWVNRLVAVEKPDGSIRICLDPMALNAALKEDYYMIPTLEELAEKIRGADYFTVLDLKDGFYQIELDEEASKLCTFATPFGCYRYKRFPFGLKMGPELCQRYNTEIFGGIDGVVIYLDDILVMGKSLEEHNRNLNAVMKLARENNAKFNEKKLQYAVREARYIGHVFSKDGIRNDPNRIRAITEMKAPVNIKELQRFLGMVNYVRNFIPNLSERLIEGRGKVYVASSARRGFC